MMSLRICIISEALKKPFDEGVKIFVYNLLKELSQTHNVLGIGRTDDFEEKINDVCSRALPRNKLFLSSYLRAKIRAFNPDMICYLPTAHATVFSFIRAKVLKCYAKKAKTVLVTLQPRDYSTAARNVMSLLVPDLVLAQSETTYQAMKELGCKAERITCGVDLEKFVPGEKNDKERLRRKYGIPVNKYVVLHVGHINRNRNAQYMERLQSMNDVQAVLVGSTSYPEDKSLVIELRRHGAILFTDYFERIQEIYQCADCYVFPVLSAGACIEIPLSILEALASDLPVVTTRFGGLPELIPEQAGLLYVDDPSDIASKVDAIRCMAPPRTRAIAEQYSWKGIAAQVAMAAQGV